jgi:hypothetical protein
MRSVKILLFFLGIVAIFVVLATLKMPSETYWWRAVHNTGHTPLFGAMSVLVLGIVYKIRGLSVGGSLSPYVIAAATTIGLGTVVEISQIHGPGDADVFDLLRDIAGVTSFLLFVLAFDRNISSFRRKNGKKNGSIFIAGALLILLGSLIPVGLWASAYFHRHRVFPTILSFDSSIEMKFVATKDAQLKSVFPPPGWHSASGNVGKVTFGIGEFPRFAIDETYPDWTGYELLEFEVFSSLKSSIEIWIRIDDIHHDQSYDDRFNKALIIQPGGNTIAIPLDTIRHAPKSREMDMRKMNTIMLYSSHPKEEFDLYFENFRLK